VKNSQARVWCFIGDAAAEEGHFYEAVKFVDSADLPCTFIVEDNNRSCDTNKAQRSSSKWIIDSKHVLIYEYQAAYPHCQIKTDKKITFKHTEPPRR
jgi:TPP-dependent pyruvate/acetoin dehydrogenase alpha subunit